MGNSGPVEVWPEPFGPGQLSFQGAPLKGDMDRNGSVNAKDLAAFLSRWGSTQPAAGDADTNQDGVVNAVDLAELLTNWS